METETTRDRSSLRDLAKSATPASQRPPLVPSADSSGVIDLEALMKEQPNWLDEAVSRAKAAPGSIPPSSLAAPVFLGPPSLAPTAFDEAPVGVPRTNFTLIAASIGAIALVAAAAGFALKSQSTVAPRAPVAAAAAQIAAPTPHVEETIPPPPPVADVAAAPVAAKSAPAADKSDDATPTQATASAAAVPDESAPTSRHGKGHGVHHAALHAAYSSPAAAEAPAPPPVPAAPPAAKSTKGLSALDAAIRGSVNPNASVPLPPTAAAAPAPAPVAAVAPAPSGGDRPDRPSGSAVTSALTSALAGARACLSGTDPSHARITFGSDGNVRSVEVSGPAGSDPKATSCIRSAFGRAHVPAFSQPTYSAGVTVRPR